ncbi:GDP-L-fucose synthase [Candidatus Parcubacteria bacterium]|nr:GDP-L-fucose synthase [Candidatus Parcubacteria bacterium]
MNKNSKIYIVGHTGMVGSAVLRKFKKENFSNIILTMRKELNLLDQKAVELFFKKEKPEYVILSAARVGGIKANMAYPADFLYENLQIQNNIIWSAYRNNVKKLLFLGSSCIYPRNCPQPMKEEYFLDGKLEPTNEGYALAKIVGIKLCEKIYEQYGKEFISCMPTNIYGENDNFDPELSHVIPALIRRMHEAKINNLKKVVIWGSGNSRREFLHVDDLADAIFWLMKNYKEKQFLNIGAGEDVSIKELALIIKNVIGYNGELAFDAAKPDGMPRKLLDVSKMDNLGWRYQISLKQGLKKTYEWFLKTV